jgi:hypothetical protein
MMTGASSNSTLNGTDSFDLPNCPQHTASQDCVTHGCFGPDKLPLAECMQANGLAADACLVVKDSFFGWKASRSSWRENLLCSGSIRRSGFLDSWRLDPHHTTPLQLHQKISCLTQDTKGYVTTVEISDISMLTIHRVVAGTHRGDPLARRDSPTGPVLPIKHNKHRPRLINRMVLSGSPTENPTRDRKHTPKPTSLRSASNVPTNKKTFPPST